jgi:hypothetical protein
MKQIIAGILCLVAAAGPGAAPRATWRLDLYHTGGRGIEIFSVDRVVVEPLPWSGSPRSDLDLSNSGSYRFELQDSTRHVIFARGYSPIYAE